MARTGDSQTLFNNELLKMHRGDFATAYFLCGDEPYYIDVLSNFVEQNVIDESLRDFNQFVFYGKDLNADITPAIFAARQYPMMGDRQVVIVKEAQHIKKWDALAAYMESPLETTILVICYKYGTPDKRQKVFKSFAQQGGVWLESAKLYDSQVPNWIMEYVRDWSNRENLNLSIDPKSVMMIAENIGNDLSRIVTELDKLILASPQGTSKITPELVERNIGISKDFNSFELQKALSSGDVVKANRIVNYFASSKDHPIQKELATIYGFFANLMLYHYLPDKSENYVAEQLKIKPFFVRDYAVAAKRFNAYKTLRIIGYIRETDARSKGINNPSTKDDGLWKELIYKILH